MKLKRSEMIERGCIHCRFYEQWTCKLSQCYMESQNDEAVTNENNIRNLCENCGYHKPGGCIGFCMKKVLVECREIWSKNKG